MTFFVVATLTDKERKVLRVSNYVNQVALYKSVFSVDIIHRFRRWDQLTPMNNVNRLTKIQTMMPQMFINQNSKLETVTHSTLTNPCPINHNTEETRCHISMEVLCGTCRAGLWPFGVHSLKKLSGPLRQIRPLTRPHPSWIFFTHDIF